MHKIDPMVAAVLFRDVLQKCHRPDIRVPHRPPADPPRMKRASPLRTAQVQVWFLTSN